MSRLVIGLLFISFFINNSCEKCKRCSYTYTVTTIVSTPNGEEEVTETKTGWVQDSLGAGWSEECVKGETEFTIEAAYEAEKLSSSLDNFDFSCEDF
jgi:hypothetical protein